MRRTVVRAMWPLAQRGEVARSVAQGVVRDVAIGQRDVGDGQPWYRPEAFEGRLPRLDHLRGWQPLHPPAATVTPASLLLVLPDARAIAQVHDVPSVRTSAALATPPWRAQNG